MLRLLAGLQMPQDKATDNDKIGRKFRATEKQAAKVSQTQRQIETGANGSGKTTLRLRHTYRVTPRHGLSLW